MMMIMINVMNVMIGRLIQGTSFDSDYFSKTAQGASALCGVSALCFWFRSLFTVRFFSFYLLLSPASVASIQSLFRFHKLFPIHPFVVFQKIFPVRVDIQICNLSFPLLTDSLTISHHTLPLHSKNYLCIVS